MPDDTDYINIEQYQELQEASQKHSKYGNKRVKADGYTFDSQAEYSRYCELKLLVKAGEIKRLRVHPPFQISDAFTVYQTGELVKARYYEADFEYYDVERMRRVVEDVKGKRTALFDLKWDLVRYRNRDEHIDFVLKNV